MQKTVSFNWQETLAYSLGIVTLLVGGYFGYTAHPDWLGRAGSLLIVYGVLLASSRKLDLLHAKVLRFIDKFRKENRKLLKDEFVKLHKRQPTEIESLTAELDVYQSAASEIAELIEERRRVFKMYEITLVVVGTVVNGFGPWLIVSAKSAA